MESQPKDLRYFLQVLEEKWPGEVLRVNTGGKTFNLVECDAAAILFKLRERGKKPAVLFEGFKTISGKPWPGQLLFSELVTVQKQAAAFHLYYPVSSRLAWRGDTCRSDGVGKLR